MIVGMPTMVRALALLALAACSPAREVRTVSLRVVGSPTWATVTIDDIAVGRLDFVAAHGIAVPPGRHHLTVDAPGFFPLDQVVEAREGSAPVRVEVKLEAVPD